MGVSILATAGSALAAVMAPGFLHEYNLRHPADPNSRGSVWDSRVSRGYLPNDVSMCIDFDSDKVKC
jgi:hypothetical protein